MAWKKTISNSEIITYEKKSKNSTVRIECRKDEQGIWRIYKTHIVNSMNHTAMNHTEEFFANTAEERDMLIEQLKKEKSLTMLDIMRKKKEMLKMPKIDIKRAYKDDSVEKWLFSIDGEKYENFFIIYESDILEIDIIANNKYSHYGKRIIDVINSILSLSASEIDINERIYFFVKSEENVMKSPIEYLYNIDF